MKRVFIVFVIIGILGLLAVALHRRINRGAQSSGPVIVTSGYVPYTWIKQLAGPQVHVEMLLPPGAEPHAFEPTPGVIVQLKKAQAFVYMSDALEPWAADLARLAGPDTRVLQLAKPFSPSDDPHSWMDFEKAGLMVSQLAALLAELDPAHQDIVAKNWEQLSGEIDQLKQDFQTALAHCTYKEVVHIGHLAFSNLLTPLHITLTPLSGSSHEGEHSAKKLAQLVREIQTKKLPAIFTEEVISPRLAQTISAETGAEILLLYPIEHISKRDFEHAITYTQLMRRNLDNLKRGLQCPAS